MTKKIKVLIVDDSALVRKIFSEELSKKPDIEVIGTAPDPFVARDKIVYLKPDVVILDIEMPKMDGLTFLEKLMRYYPIPVIIVSSLSKNGEETFLKAMEFGAVEVMAKPGASYSVTDMSDQLAEKIRAAAMVKVFHKKNTNSLSNNTNVQKNAMIKTTNSIIAIGASTGGTEAIRYLLNRLPSDMPPIIIVQHMPENFTKSFADNLNRQCSLNVSEAQDGDLLSQGKVLIAPGNKHMTLGRSGASYYVEIKDGPLIHHQRPSVEVLFSSVAKFAGKNAVGIILTGMGKDGASGLLEMRNAGAITIAQDEKSCIVYGMPKEAVDIGAAMKVLSLENILLQLISINS